MEGIVDSHTHVSLLPYEGLENMALADDPLSLPKAVRYLEMNGAPPEIIARIARYNAEELFGI